MALNRRIALRDTERRRVCDGTGALKAVLWVPWCQQCTKQTDYMRAEVECLMETTGDNVIPRLSKKTSRTTEVIAIPSPFQDPTHLAQFTSKIPLFLQHNSNSEKFWDLILYGRNTILQQWLTYFLKIILSNFLGFFCSLFFSFYCLIFLNFNQVLNT